MSFKSLYCLTLTLSVFSALGFCAAKPAIASSLSYSITDLGILSGGSQSFAKGINNSGTVVGYADVTSDGYHAFLYNNGTMTGCVAKMVG